MAGPSKNIADAVAAIRWYHTIDLGNGIVTPGLNDTRLLVRRLRLPESLAGKTVLDIGAFDGAISFECERRGASRVLATDWFCWGGASRLGLFPAGWGTKDGFELARRVLESRVEDLTIDIPDISPETIGTFDIVLFLGVLYHLKHPMLAMERVASVTKEMVILETAADFLDIRRPAIAFYPGDELNNDSTNWIGPNTAACAAMLRVVGFKRVDVIDVPGFPRRLARAIRARYLLLKSRNAREWMPGTGKFFRTLAGGRIILHAWK